MGECWTFSICQLPPGSICKSTNTTPKTRSTTRSHKSANCLMFDTKLWPRHKKSVSGLGGIFFLARITRKAINIRLTRSGLTDNHRHRHTHARLHWPMMMMIWSFNYFRFFLYQSNSWNSHVILSYPLTLWCQSANDSIQTNPAATKKNEHLAKT